jgi:hypothetical protein
MDRQSKDKAAKVDGEELELFVRSSPRDLEPGDLELVAGGIGTCIVPWG